MNVIPLLLLFLLLVGKALGEDLVRIGESTFVRAYNEENKDGSLQEFLPPAETLEAWTTLVGIRIFRNISSPKEFIGNMASEYGKRFPLNKFAVFENKETGAWIIDYIIFPPDRDKG